MEIQQWLSQTTAAEVMVREVVTLRPELLLSEAAHLLLTEQISGAPVVDAEGRCVGVLSVVDLVSAPEEVAEEQRKILQSSFWKSNLALPMSIYADKLAEVRDQVLPAAQQPVQRFMTTDVVSVQEETSLEVVVRDMVDGHVHRVLVLDAQERLQGLISTTDVLAALQRAAAGVRLA